MRIQRQYDQHADWHERRRERREDDGLLEHAVWLILGRITDQHSTAGRAPSRVGITRTVPPGRSVAAFGYPVFGASCVLISVAIAMQLLRTRFSSVPTFVL